jgi:hypothetical protein
MPELLAVFELGFGILARRLVVENKEKKDNGTKHPDPKFYFPPINGCGTQAHMDRRKPPSWLGLLRMRLGVQRF